MGAGDCSGNSPSNRTPCTCCRSPTLNSGQFEFALEYFERVVRAAPGRPDFWGNYANACWECGHLERAQALVEKAISLSPDAPEPHNIKGNILLAQSRFPEAEKAFLESHQPSH